MSDHVTNNPPVAWAYVNDEGECEQIEWGMKDFPANDDSTGLVKLYLLPKREDLTQDLAMLTRRLARALKRAGTDDTLVTVTTAFLVKHGLAGDIIRLKK